MVLDLIIIIIIILRNKEIIRLTRRRKMPSSTSTLVHQQRSGREPLASDRESNEPWEDHQGHSPRTGCSDSINRKNYRLQTSNSSKLDVSSHCIDGNATGQCLLDTATASIRPGGEDAE